MKRWSGALVLTCGACSHWYDQAPPVQTANTANADAKDAGKAEIVLGTGVPAEVEQAAERLQTSCDAGDAKGCFDLGQLFASSKWNAKDDKRAAELFGKSCDGGHQPACENLAEAYEHGRGVAKDTSRARVLYDLACRARRAFSCGTLGTAYAAGHEVTRDLRRAKELLQLGCEEGDSASCNLRQTVDGCTQGEKSACTQLDDLRARFEEQDKRP
jgi:TPR repeat protein